MYIYIYMLMRGVEGRSTQGQTNNKAKQHSTPKLPVPVLARVGTHDTLHSRQSALPLSYQGSSAGWTQISHLIVHLKHWLRIYIIMGLSPAQGSSSIFKHCLLYFGLLSTFMYDYTCTWLTMLMYMYVCVLPGLLVLMYMFLMRDEKEERRKQHVILS